MSPQLKSKELRGFQVCMYKEPRKKSRPSSLPRVLLHGNGVVIFAAHVRALIHLRNTDEVLSKLNMLAWWMEQAESNAGTLAPPS